MVPRLTAAIILSGSAVEVMAIPERQRILGFKNRPLVIVPVRQHTSALGVRREKAALSKWVQVPPGKRSSRKQPEQLWR